MKHVLEGTNLEVCTYALPKVSSVKVAFIQDDLLSLSILCNAIFSLKELSKRSL